MLWRSGLRELLPSSTPFPAFTARDLHRPYNLVIRIFPPDLIKTPSPPTLIRNIGTLMKPVLVLFFFYSPLWPSCKTSISSLPVGSNVLTDTYFPGLKSPSGFIFFASQLPSPHMPFPKFRCVLRDFFRKPRQMRLVIFLSLPLYRSPRLCVTFL